jgi:hypothetical protein
VNPDLVQCAVCGAVAPGALRRQGSFDVRTIEDHTSEISGYPCHGTRYVFHKPVDPDNPTPPRLCRTCRRPFTAANAADHRRNCH